MTLSLHLLSAPGREAILARTLASWARTDFGETGPRLHLDTATFASLYDPGLPASVPPTAALLARTYFPADPVHFFGAPLPVHRPTLIEHTATLSAWGTRLHHASQFDPEWVEKP